MRMKQAGPSALLLLAACLAACAKIEPPPGGPPDVTPPHLLGTSPDSNAVLPKFDGAAAFRFDEVIAEGSQPSFGRGTSDLEKLIVLSPSSRVPSVRWRRDRIEVRPAEGWRPDRVYRIELLPGVADLRGNRMPTGATLTFTTGAPAPTTVLTGAVNDWVTGQPARGALVEAVLLPIAPGDTIAYRSAADSTGRFRLGPLPRGAYLVYGALDANRNFRLDPREAYDTSRVGPDTTAVRALWTFPHDTAGPRLQSVAVLDSLAATLTFSQPLDPTQRYDTSEVRVRLLPDSTPVAVRSLLTQAADDSLHRKAPAAPREGRDTTRAPGDTTQAPRDTTRAPGDTTRAPRDTTAVPARPKLTDRLVVRVATPWKPGGRYLVELTGIRNVSRAAADSRNTLVVPEPKAAADSAARDSTRIRADSAGARRVPADTMPRAHPDSTRPTRPDSAPPPRADSVARPPQR